MQWVKGCGYHMLNGWNRKKIWIQEHVNLNSVKIKFLGLKFIKFQIWRTRKTTTRGNGQLYSTCLVLRERFKKTYEETPTISRLLYNRILVSSPGAGAQVHCSRRQPVPTLLTRINFNPSMDKYLYPSWSVGWNYLSILKIKREWELINDFIPHFTGHAKSMLGLKLSPFSKISPWGAFQKPCAGSSDGNKPLQVCVS